MTHSAIKLPEDQYRHPEAPNEWWWHTGTLVDGEQRFGFEINACKRLFGGKPFLFSEMMLTDCTTGDHYQNTQLYPYDKGHS